MRFGRQASMVVVPLPLDVQNRLVRDFGTRADTVAAQLITHRRLGSADFHGDRLLRCIIQASGGDEQRVQQLLDIARQDYRDVIVAGEYDGFKRQVKDFRASFLLDTPEKFWVGEVACMMASLGYRLMALESRAAIAGPFEYSADYVEGRATFTGRMGDIRVEKKNRLWLIHGNRHELEIHELGQPYSDEHAFRDRVSGYLQSKMVEPLSLLTDLTENENP